MSDPTPYKRIILPPGWTLDDLIVWAHRPELYDTEPRIETEEAASGIGEVDEINMDGLPELTQEDRAAMEQLGSSKDFIARLNAMLVDRAQSNPSETT